MAKILSGVSVPVAVRQQKAGNGSEQQTDGWSVLLNRYKNPTHHSFLNITKL
ncbi:MAG: hypothetical protein MRZ45_04705 [Blautia sp.]|nr:hypothetical protein [Blautia sp.]MDY4515919.1 hypothetical protein [Lachnospiraceae bacterium]